MDLILTGTKGMALNLAERYGGASKWCDDWLSTADGRAVIAWTGGMTFRHAYPGEYKPGWKRYRPQDLPMLPGEMRFKPLIQKKPLYADVKSHMEKADRVIHAGKPDRAGQASVDWMLFHLGWAGTVVRWDTRLLSRAALTEGGNDLGAWTASEKCRMHADWLVGINMTRAITMETENATSILVGRVATPVLARIADGLTEMREQSACVRAMPMDMATTQARLARSGTTPREAAMLALGMYEKGLISYPMTSRRTMPKRDDGYRDWLTRLARLDGMREAATKVMGILGSADEATGVFQWDGFMAPHGILVNPISLSRYSRLTLDEQATYRLLAKAAIDALAGEQERPHPRRGYGLPEALEDMGDVSTWLSAKELAGGTRSIGAPATRHVLLERLVERGLVDLRNNQFSLTRLGATALNKVPGSLKDPGVTLLWENALERVAAGEMTEAAFMKDVGGYVSRLVDEARKLS